MSGRKNVLLPKHLLVDGDMSGNLTSDPISAQFQDNIGLQVEWTGSPSGTFAVEASINWDERLQTGSFYELTFNPVLADAEGSASGYLINLNQLPFSYYRLAYTSLSSSGTLNVYATSKEI